MPNGRIAVYFIYVTVDSGPINSYPVYDETTVYTVTNLNPYSLVGISISASTMIGEGPLSQEIRNRTEQTGTNQFLLNFVSVSH